LVIKKNFWLAGQIIFIALADSKLKRSRN